MRKLLVALVVIGGLALAVNFTSRGADDKPVAIKEVMKTCMAKGGLCSKVAGGNASAEEKKKLVAMFEDLHKNKPPKGDAESWNKFTTALVDAAKAAAEGKEGAGDALKKAANCMGCHGAHKGKK
jgi:cytochrome c553